MGLLFAALLALGADAPALTEADAVSAALNRSRELIAARLNVEAAEVDKVAAAIWPNPQFAYGAGNLVIPPGNPQPPENINPGFFSQPIHTVSLSQTFDVWFKHSKRVEAAERGTEVARLQVEQAGREVVHSVRGAFAEVLHAQEERDLAEEARTRYDETLRLSNAQFKVGSISKNNFKKIELEQLRYWQGEHEAELSLKVAREKLAELLVLAPGTLPPKLEPTSTSTATEEDPQWLTKRALDLRPDLRAQRKSIERAEAALSSAHRDAFPDVSIGLSYARDYFTISGDNPQSVGFTVGIPLPVFDRNQGGIGHAAVDVRSAENDRDKLELAVQHDVAEAVSRIKSARTVQKLLHEEVEPRATDALNVAEKEFHLGNTSLLELLEAQRTYVDVRRDAAQALLNYRQATIDVAYAVGGNP
jgi:cobalt-zinc-cadmium efflux system outer membrane protein